MEPSVPGYQVSDYYMCPDSSNGYCEYKREDVCRDECVHCGEPEERK